MFNSYGVNVKGGQTTNHMQINAVSGTLVKNHPKSFFKRFHTNSPYAERIFSHEPYFETEETVTYSHTTETYKKTIQNKAIILQVMLCGESEFIAEIVRLDDYELDIEE